MARQIVYVLVNPAMSGLVKIGKTTADDLSWRLGQLYSTGVPVPFECAYACEVGDCHQVEKALHLAFGDHRINPSREFFEIEPARVAAVLKLVATADITCEVTGLLPEGVTPEDVESGNRLTVSRRPRFSFEQLGVPIGAELIFVDDSSIRATVVTGNKVEHGGEVYSLTKLTSELLGLNYPIGPTPRWTYSGRSLWDLYNEYHGPEV